MREPSELKKYFSSPDRDMRYINVKVTGLEVTKRIKKEKSSEIFDKSIFFSPSLVQWCRFAIQNEKFVPQNII